ncbi:MAG TPA: dihydroorotase [Candidatus Krumholzibacteria bacterium]|nr:dihydroorotase [Candidatus Krumholzibacteria bacterium]HPD70962.1 dihydroorotase [Candidatus Krumholzibacteria bacterium]HRY39338.1 dihydroorotase [Candidatus Krumholzibacteria bacterium]
MEWSWQRIPAEYLVTGVKLAQGGKIGARKGFLHVKKGRVESIGAGTPTVEGVPALAADGLVLAPGFVDTHVHFREPGQEEKETVASGSRAAAAGGFTTVVTMPNTDPPIDNAGMVRYVIDRGVESGLCRVLPTGAISVGRKGETLAELGAMAEAGAVAFTDDGSPVASGKLMSNALKYARLLGVPIMTHAEDLTIVGDGCMHAGYWSTRLGLPGMARASEDAATFRDIELARAGGAHLHVAHVSTRGSVAIIRRAKAEGVRVTAEATPHHFSLEHSRCRDYSPLFKMNPPLREPEDVAAVADGLADGTIDCIATDHAPHTATEKELQFDQAPFGVIGLETAFAVGVTYLVEGGKLDLGRLIQCFTERPAAVLGLPLGRLEEGGEADFVLLATDREWVVTPASLRSRSRNSAFLGETLKGQVVATFLRGRLTWHQEEPSLG